MKNILVITGSPRKNANSSMLADAFIKGALSKGHSVERFDAGNITISGCTACDKCWSGGTACVIRDDFTYLEPLLEKADVIVVAFPLYWYSFPAQLKAVIDRFYAYCSPIAARKLKIKESLKLVSLGDVDEAAVTGLKYASSAIAGLMGWKNIGSLYAMGLNKAGEVKDTDYLTEAEALGKSV